VANKIVPEVTSAVEIENLLSWATGDDFLASVERMRNWLSESARINLAIISTELQGRVQRKQQLIQIRLLQLEKTNGGGHGDEHIDSC